MQEFIPYILFVSMIYFAFKYYRANKKLETERIKANEVIKNRDELIAERNKLIHKLELETLKFQVSPHSLRNTLNVVKYYTETANSAIGRLTNVLDYLLYESGVDSICLKDEIMFAKNFHDLMKIRTSDLVRTEFNERINNDSLIENIQVPPMITAYFLENAYKHGELLSEAKIEIEIYIEETELVYKVINTLKRNVNATQGKGGIGLYNMKKRLAILYPERFTIKTEPIDNEFLSELRLKIN